MRGCYTRSLPLNRAGSRGSKWDISWDIGFRSLTTSASAPAIPMPVKLLEYRVGFLELNRKVLWVTWPPGLRIPAQREGYSGGSVLGAVFVFFQTRAAHDLVANSFCTTPLAEAVGKLIGTVRNGEFSQL